MVYIFFPDWEVQFSGYFFHLFYLFFSEEEVEYVVIKFMSLFSSGYH